MDIIALTGLFVIVANSFWEVGKFMTENRKRRTIKCTDMKAE